MRVGAASDAPVGLTLPQLAVGEAARSLALMWLAWGEDQGEALGPASSCGRLSRGRRHGAVCAGFGGGAIDFEEGLGKQLGKPGRL